MADDAITQGGIRGLGSPSYICEITSTLESFNLHNALWVDLSHLSEECVSFGEVYCLGVEFDNFG